MDESLNIWKSKSFDCLASQLIADVITNRLLCDPDNEFNIDDYWCDLRKDVLQECKERMSSVQFLLNDED